jgi:hypothetical protein
MEMMVTAIGWLLHLLFLPRPEYEPAVLSKKKKNKQTAASHNWQLLIQTKGSLYYKL